MTTPAGQRELMPPPVLPWLYFGCAWLALGLAFAALALEPRAAAGFFYHARLAGIVHLVTLGWLTLSILGALYLVGPIALRMPLPARRGDAVAFACTVIGIIGMVGHFWIEQFGGMAWSGMAVAAGILFVGGRVVFALRRAPIPGAIKLHIVLAFANIAIAATVGISIAFDKVFYFLPGFILTNVIGHAHLAIVGWVTMMIVGVGYRVLPMALPAVLPQSRSLWASAVLLETGALGLFVTIVLRTRWAALFAAIAVAGLAVFGAHVADMLRTRRRPPASAPQIDYTLRHMVLAFGSLAVAIALGAFLVVSDPSPWTMRAASAYGVFVLVGFLAQVVVAMHVYLLPLLAWYTAAHRVARPDDIPPMTRLRAYPAAGVVWLLWLCGVPALAGGFAFDAIPFLAAGAAALEAATIISGVHAIQLAVLAFRSRPSGAACGTQQEPSTSCP